MRSLPLAAWAGALTAAGLLLACDRTPAPSASSNPRLAAALKERAQELDARETNVGMLVPDLAYTDLDGHSGHLSDFRGRTLVLAVRDVGCPVSQRTAPALARLEDEYRARDVAFLFLNESPHNTPDEIRGDIAAHGFDAPTIHDAEQRLDAEPVALGVRDLAAISSTPGPRHLGADGGGDRGVLARLQIARIEIEGGALGEVIPASRSASSQAKSPASAGATVSSRRSMGLPVQSAWRSSRRPGTFASAPSQWARMASSRAFAAAWSRHAHASSAAIVPATPSLPTFMVRPMPRF